MRPFQQASSWPCLQSHHFWVHASAISTLVWVHSPLSSPQSPAVVNLKPWVVWSPDGASTPFSITKSSWWVRCAWTLSGGRQARWCSQGWSIVSGRLIPLASRLLAAFEVSIREAVVVHKLLRKASLQRGYCAKLSFRLIARSFSQLLLIHLGEPLTEFQASFQNLQCLQPLS